MVRQAPDSPPEPSQPSRLVRQVPEDVNSSSRVARQAVNGEFEKPKHIRQEAFYSSITSMTRKKRGSNNRETAIRG